MNFALLKNTIKTNWKLVLIFGAVLCMYEGVILALFNPAEPESVKELFAMLPPAMLAMFGMSVEAFTSPLYYLAGSFFGVMVMAFSMVFYVLQSTKLVAKAVDNNSLAYTLSMPISRTKFIITQAVYLIGSICAIFVAMLLTGTIVLATFGSFDFLAFLNLIAVTFLLNVAIALVSFLLSVAFCDSKKGFSLAVGVPIGLLLVSMLGGAGGDNTKWLAKISPFGWIDSVGIISGEVSTWWMYLVFAIVAAALVYVSTIIFKKKRLPL